MFSEMDVFEENHAFPFSKQLTFMRTGPFYIDGRYARPNHIPFPDAQIGRFQIDGITPTESGESRKIKLKVRLNQNGMFAVSSAVLVDTIEVPVKADDVKQQSDKPESMDTSTTAPDASADADVDDLLQRYEQEMKSDEITTGDANVNGDQAKKTKKKTVTVDLPVSEQGRVDYDTQMLNSYRAIEARIQEKDRAEKDKIDSKNALEEYIYEMRGKLEDPYKEYVTPKDGETLLSLLAAAEDWLYADGEDADRDTYARRLTELCALGDPIAERYREAQLRPPALESLGQAIQQARKVVDLYMSKNEKYAHLEPKDIDKLRKAVDDKQKWLDDTANKCAKRQSTLPPVVTAQQITAEQEVSVQRASNGRAQAFENIVRPIANKPKPAPPKAQPPPPSPGDAQNDPKKADAAPGSESNGATHTNGNVEEMAE